MYDIVVSHDKLGTSFTVLLIPSSSLSSASLHTVIRNAIYDLETYGVYNHWKVSTKLLLVLSFSTFTSPCLGSKTFVSRLTGDIEGYENES